MIKIRQAFTEDATTLMEIAEKCWWPTYQGIISSAQIRFMLDEMYAEEVILQQMVSGSQTYLVLSEADRAIGFASYGDDTGKAAVGRIFKLYCLPEVQGNGYGAQLVREVERRVIDAGLKVLKLNVNRQNKARSFYEKMGFTIDSEVDIAIGDFWMNDFVMMKQLA